MKKTHELRRKLIAWFVVLSMILSDAAPIFPGNAALADGEESVLTCGLTEHTHTEACYEDVLTCGKEASDPKFINTFKVHHHSDDCRNSAGELICGYVEDEYYHTHNEYCRNAEGKLVCGLETRKPHDHTDECYRTDRILICENNDQGHTHTAECYKDWKELTCGKEEQEGHQHTDECYKEKQVLTCEKAEDPGHTHTDECYTTRTELTCDEEHEHGEECYTTTRVLTCEQQERAGHTHSGDCYRTEKELICGKEERTGHHHEDACYTAHHDLICGQTERPAHVHGDECYKETRTLICDKPSSKHKHTEDCFDGNGNCICGKVEIPVFECSEENWTAGHTHSESCYDRKLICEIPEHIHTEDCWTTVSQPEPEPEPEEPVTDPVEETEEETEKIDTWKGIREQEEEPPKQENESEDQEEEPADQEEDSEEQEEEPDNQKKEPIDQDETSEDQNEESEDQGEEPDNQKKEPIDQEEESEDKDEEAENQSEEPDNQEEDPEDLNENPDNQEEELEDQDETPENLEEESVDQKDEPEDQEEDIPTTIATDENAPIQVSITYNADAAIPEGTEIIVFDPDMEQLKTASKKLTPAKSGLRNTALASDRSAGNEFSTADVSLEQWKAGENPPEIQLYHRILDISLSVDGEEIEPESPVTVSITLPDLEDGLTVTVKHQTENGLVELQSSTEGQTVTFITDGFSLFDFTSTAQKITSWTSDWLENTLYGRSNNQNVNHGTISIDEDSIPDGFSIIDTTSSPQDSNLWITLQRVKDIVLGKLESISLYAVENGKITALVKENVGITDVLRLNLGNYSSFALVRDSGLRSRIEELGNVILSGLMPKNGVAEATDVTEEYENFLGGRSVSKEGEADEDLGGQSSDKEGEAVHTIAAFDITITNDGEEYQPEGNPVSVSIQDEEIATAVANGNALTLWHVIDENNAERVESFTVDGDTVTFDASGFSVYVITETTVEKIMTAADGNVYRITVTYDGSAQIPEGAEVVVNEVDEGEYLSSTAAALGIDEDNLLYRKFLDISFKTSDENGEERIIEPASPVKVQIELLDVEVGADKLQVVHFGEDGAEKVSSTSSADAVITFTSDEFSVYGFGNVLEPLATAETDEASIELLGFGADTQMTSTDAPVVEEGLEVLGAYNVSESDKIWIKAELKDDVELSSMESVAIYSVKDSTGEDETAGKTVEELAEAGSIVELTSTEFAVIKDTGYRHLSFNIMPDEADEEKTVTLDGMMPKAAEAVAVDVTEDYTDHEFSESAPVYSEETPSVDDEENDETAPVDDEDADGVEEEQPENNNEQTDHTTSRVTLAAFDISITAGDQDYQPDVTHPVAVTITDERIMSGDHIELWHIRDDGSEERVSNFTVEIGTLSFTATGFSTYAIVYNITTYYQSADGETYKITVEYGDEAELPEGVELRVTEVDNQEYLADAATALETEESYLLYKKFLDISFVTIDENGEEKAVEPSAPVKVSIELQDVTAGADKLQVVHFSEDGAEKLTSTANDAAVITFETGSFSVFGIGNVLTSLATAETDIANIEVLGFSGEVKLSTADAPTVEEGLEVLGAYSLSNEDEKVWIKADVKDGVELSSMESVVIYTIGGEDTAEEAGEEQSDETAEEQNSDDAEEKSGEALEQAETTTQITELALAGTVAELNVSNFALVKDTGYRHLSFEISVGGSETTAEDGEEETERTGVESSEESGKKVILDGMMPKMATATAVDVTDAYADHEYIFPEEEHAEQEESVDAAEEQLVSNDAGEDAEEPVDEESQETVDEPLDSVEEAHEGEEETQNSEAEEQKRTTLAAFNITISNNESEYQPDEAHPITVEIRDSRIVAGENLELWHIRDDGTEERVEEFELTEGKVAFIAYGFSAYAIVEGPTSGEFGYVSLTTIQEIIDFSNQGYGFYIDGCQYPGYYFTDGTQNVKGRNLIKKTDYSASPATATGAVQYYFELISEQDHQFKVYCGSGDNKKYIVQSGNSLNLSSSDATVFTLEESTYNKSPSFRVLGNDNWYWTMQGGKNGNGYAAYKPPDANCHFRIQYYIELSEDPYELDNKTYGLMYWNGGIAGKGLMASSANINTLDAKAMEVLSKKNGNVVERLYVPSDSDISMWTFHWAGNDTYKISTDIEGTINYLMIDSNGVSLTTLIDNASIIQVIPGSSASQENEICLKANGYTLTYSGSIDGGFTNGGSVGNEWLYLVDYSELTSEYLVTYSAKKVSVSDSTVTNGSKVIVYTRTWNDTLKQYEFYAVDHDGSLVECFESGDSIQWIGNRINSLLWDFTEYYWEGTTDPNFYYEMYNEYSGKYIAPQIAGNQILSSNKIGINMPGRRNVAYHSTIIAWDELHQVFAGVKAADDNSEIESCDMEEAGSFYFAIVQDANIEDVTNTVETVDNSLYGITMKLVDCDQPAMNTAMGNTSNGNYTGLLSTNLNANGYPTITNTSSSLGTLYSGAQEVNHLFIESTYYASGYYEYDSTQNFASLKGATGGDFTVYQELGTHDGESKTTLKHGQFLPYNDIQAGLFAVNNPQNLYSALADYQRPSVGLLPDSDPRKYEKLYLVTNPNFYFAMEMEASFVQTPSGLDAWGHDIIYEFTGDDDFWLYVDGELVIDLGGMHSAQWGKVNFRTGSVTGSMGNTNTTLRAIFEENYRARNPGASSEDVSNYLAEYFNDGEAWFKDYTNHTMKIFYMERGAGASNLHMRFNLASVKDGTIELSKKLSGVSNTESLLAEFPYQIWYREDESAAEKQLTPDTKLNNDDDMRISVKYKDTDNDVTYRSSITVDGITYNDVYMLKPDQTAVIEMPDDGIYYRVVECGVNTSVYSSVTTREEIPIIETQGSGYSANRADYGIEYAMTRKRTRVTYINTVDPNALRTLMITKKLFDVTGLNEVHDDDTTFTFRLSLDYEYNDTTTLADMFIYHVKDEDGFYCHWDATLQRFVAIEDENGHGISDYSSLSETQLKQASFNTSIYGSISHIPSYYTIEIRELLIGTKYQVEERRSEIPDGYSLQKYELNLINSENNTSTSVALADDRSPVSGTIGEGVDPHVYVRNVQGYGLRMYKSWLDEDYMENRDPAYFAVYTKDANENLTLVPETIMELKYKKYTLYWYFQELNDIPFENYVIREVSLTNPVVDSDGYVTSYNTITPVAPGGKINIQGTQKGESSASPQEYTVTYNQGSLTGENNVRIDYVENSRSGLVIRKEDFEGNVLDNSTFTLVDADDQLNATYTSDSTGYVTTAFLRTGVTYTLTETKAKTGYHGLEASMTITKDSSGIISVSGVDSGFYTLTDNDGTSEPILTIKNKAFTFAVRKQDSVTEHLLAGAHFSLYRQITVGGVTLIDFNPMTGYEDLVTGDDGIIPGINQTLPAGTYELRETTAPAGYEVLSSGIVFSLDDIGTITLGRKHPADTVLERADSEDGKRILYTLKIPNSADSTLVDLTITKTVEGDMGDRSQNFAFSLESVEDEIAGTEYGYTITKADGTNQTWYLKTTDGENEFNLAHGDSIVISVPIGKAVVIKEENGFYSTDWALNGTTLTADVNNAVEVTITEAGTLVVTNTMNAVAPTAYTSRHTPYLLLLLFGLMLLIGGGVVVKKRRGDDPDDGVVAVNPTPRNNGLPGEDNPPVARRREMVNAGQTTHSTTDAEDHIRWRNSVWVENNGPQRGFAPPQANVPCPQAKLWMTRTGPTRKRGDAG